MSLTAFQAVPGSPRLPIRNIKTEDQEEKGQDFNFPVPVPSPSLRAWVNTEIMEFDRLQVRFARPSNRTMAPCQVLHSSLNMVHVR
jgi:hypothetical protein